MNVPRAGMGKFGDILKRVAIGETLVWAIFGIVIVIGVSTTSSHSGEEMWAAGGVVILLGMISGLTLFSATKRNEAVIYKIWFGETVVLLLSLGLGLIFSLIFHIRHDPSFSGFVFHFWFYIGFTFFLLLIPAKVYCFWVVWKFYKWSDRAGFVNVATSTF